MMFPNPVLRQTRKQTVIEIQRCFVHRPYQPNELKEATEESPDTKTEMGGPSLGLDKDGRLNRTARGKGDCVRIELSRKVQQH